MQILDEGRLTDSHGKVVSFRNALIVLTSNVGVSEIPDNQEFTNEEEEQFILEGMRKKFSPEFINRIDNVIVFNTLAQPEIQKIVDLQMRKLTKRLSAVGVSMIYTDDVVAWVAEHGYQKNYGVRPIRRLIQTQIEDKISELIITQQVDSITINVVDGAINVQSSR